MKNKIKYIILINKHFQSGLNKNKMISEHNTHKMTTN